AFCSGHVMPTTISTTSTWPESVASPMACEGRSSESIGMAARRLILRSTVNQITHHQAERHFAIVSLKPARHGDPDPALCLGIARTLEKEIRIATEIIRWRQRDRIDALLERGAAGGRKSGDPMRERSDELAKLRGRQRSIDPPVSLGQLRIVVVGAEDRFERPRATQETRQVLDAARAGDQAEAFFRLTEDRRLPRGKAHVARQDELVAGAAHAPRDPRDGDEATGAQVAKQHADRRLA